MTAALPGDIKAAEIVLPCTEFHVTLPFFTERLGFRVDSIFPADDPAVVQLSGHGLHLRLERGGGGDPGTLRLLSTSPVAIATESRRITAPNGTRIEIADADPPVAVPPVRHALVVTRIGDDAAWGTGRAGMQYRDLVPGRLGGYVIASHIRIPDAGPVPDYVHFHKIRFQMIYCARGWVRVVYEDQGPPFVMRQGDCVLQPPAIRHRVLESGDGLEVIEIGCPAEHITCVDHGLTLPTDGVRPERDFGGQRFVRHQAANAVWQPWILEEFEARDTGISGATDGIAGACVVRPSGESSAASFQHQARFLLAFVLNGQLRLSGAGREEAPLKAGDSAALPPATDLVLSDWSSDLELLVVSMPEIREVGGKAA